MNNTTLKLQFFIKDQQGDDQIPSEVQITIGSKSIKLEVSAINWSIERLLEAADEVCKNNGFEFRWENEDGDHDWIWLMNDNELKITEYDGEVLIQGKVNNFQTEVVRSVTDAINQMKEGKMTDMLEQSPLDKLNTLKKLINESKGEK